MGKKWLIIFNPQKTEVMLISKLMLILISNVFNDKNFELKIDGTILKIVKAHKGTGNQLY